MLELELVQQIEKYFNRYQIRCAKEVHMGIGVPDLSINIGASKSIPLLYDYYILILIEFLINHNSISINVLMQLFPFDKQKILSYLNQLKRDKIIYQRGNKIYIQRKVFGLNLGKTISIEAKIKDWRNGILQAERYLMFSDYSYLALPKEKIKNVDLDYIKQKGIGLMSVDISGINEVIQPVRSVECEYKQKYILTSYIIKNSLNLNKRRSDDIFSKLL